MHIKLDINIFYFLLVTTFKQIIFRQMLKFWGHFNLSTFLFFSDN